MILDNVLVVSDMVTKRVTPYNRKYDAFGVFKTTLLHNYTQYFVNFKPLAGKTIYPEGRKRKLIIASGKRGSNPL